MSLARWRPSWTSTSTTGARLSAASCGKPCRAGWPEVRIRTIISEPADNGLRTVLDIQSIGNTRYFDRGGFFFVFGFLGRLSCVRAYSVVGACVQFNAYSEEVTRTTCSVRSLTFQEE
jgi:hypothetical protein